MSNKEIKKIIYERLNQVGEQFDEDFLFDYVDNSVKIRMLKDFYKVEDYYNKLMEKLYFLNKLVKEQKTTERKDEISKDFA